MKILYGLLVLLGLGGFVLSIIVKEPNLWCLTTATLAAGGIFRELTFEKEI